MKKFYLSEASKPKRTSLANFVIRKITNSRQYESNELIDTGLMHTEQEDAASNRTLFHMNASNALSLLKSLRSLIFAACQSHEEGNLNDLVAFLADSINDG